MRQEQGVPPGKQARTLAWSALFRRALHDLNQPLNLIQVIAQDVRLDASKGRLKTETLPSTMREIEEAISEVITSLERFRVLAKAGSIRSREQSFDAKQATCAAIERIRRSHPALEVSSHFPVDLPAAKGNSFLFQQAVWEVLDNASHAVSQAHAMLGRCLSIGVRVDVRDEAIVVRVRDSGGGVADENRARIFDPFFTTREGAEGLGLALARLLAQSMGGSVVLAASNSDGSVFELTVQTLAPS